MLQELYVENVALIRRARVPFGPGFNVLTGETGAGKSLILDALGLAVGLRAGGELVRGGEEPVRVDAVFELPASHPAARRLAALGFEGEDGVWVLSREVGRAGRGRCRINGRPVSTAELAQAGELLVSIHTQSESHRLLRPSVQLELLDAFAGEKAAGLREQLHRLYTQLRETRERHRQVAEQEQRRLQEMDLLRYQIEEIAAAGLKAGEEEQLQAEYQRLAAAERLRELVRTALQELSAPVGGRSGASVVEALGRAEAALGQASTLDGHLSPYVARLRSLAEAVQELARELRHLAERYEPDPQRLSQLAARLELVDRLRRKYGPTVEAILAYMEQARQRLQGLEAAQSEAAELQTRAEALQQQYLQAASELSRLRREAAERLGQEVCRELRELALPHARFEVELQSGSHGPWGWDQVEFLFSANPGEPLRPLAQVASGGELSRTMLACRVVLAAVDPVPVLVFDEPDAGLGGRAAQAVGERLAWLSRSHQVLVVTHLPQVACLAHHHLCVTKHEQQGKTWVEVQALGFEERVEELARMLGGARITETTRRHAEEMLRLAQQARATG